jgi:hypothetical protein
MGGIDGTLTYPRCSDPGDGDGSRVSILFRRAGREIHLEGCIGENRQIGMDGRLEMPVYCSLDKLVSPPGDITLLGRVMATPF